MKSLPIASAHPTPTTPWAIAANGAETEQFSAARNNLPSDPVFPKRENDPPGLHSEEAGIGLLALTPWKEIACHGASCYGESRH